MKPNYRLYHGGCLNAVEDVFVDNNGTVIDQRGYAYDTKFGCSGWNNDKFEPILGTETFMKENI